MWAAIAAARVGERRILELVGKYGVDTFTRSLGYFMDYGEQVALRALADLPKGKFSLEEEQDSGTVFRVTVEIGGDELVVDLRDNPSQDPGPNNVSRDGAMIAAQMVFMNLTDPHASANAGHFRPLRVLTRPGSVFDARPPAAFATYYEVRIRLYDLMWRCLAPHLGARLPAGHFGSICGTFIGGRHPDTGRHFTIVEPQVGGWGGSASRDGNIAMFSAVHGHTFNCPAEVAEARYGLYVDRQALNDEPGGEGEHRGGKGIVLDYRVRSDGCFLTCAYTRNKHRPWPLNGGLEGSPNYAEVIRKGGKVEEYAVVTALELNQGDVIRIHTGNGGGYGHPRRRRRELVLDDLVNGYVTAEGARSVYGLDADELTMSEDTHVRTHEHLSFSCVSADERRANRMGRAGIEPATLGSKVRLDKLRRTRDIETCCKLRHSSLQRTEATCTRRRQACTRAVRAARWPHGQQIRTSPLRPSSSRHYSRTACGVRESVFMLRGCIRGSARPVDLGA